MPAEAVHVAHGCFLIGRPAYAGFLFDCRVPVKGRQTAGTSTHVVGPVIRLPGATLCAIRPETSLGGNRMPGIDIASSMPSA
jgi:hypothetical protein